MRFVHAADIHLDSPLRDLPRHQDVPAERIRLAPREAFEGLIDLCIRRDAAFLVLAGDLYDSDCANMQVARFLRDQLVRLDRHGIRVVIKKGNHDADNRITGALSLPANTTVLRDDRPETVSFDHLPVPVAIHGQSFRRGQGGENLAAGYPAPLAGHLNIGVLHTSLAGNTEHDVYAPCSLAELQSRGYAYWALGHVHKGEVLSRSPSWVVYPGNLQGRHARETGPKGCMLVEVEGTEIRAAEPIALDVVRWHHGQVDLRGADRGEHLVERLRGALAAAWRQAEGRPLALRLSLTGPTALHGLVGRRPEWLRQTVLELTGEIEGEIWIEKIRDRTAPEAAPAGVEDAGLAAGEAADELLGLMREIAADPETFGCLLRDALGPLRAKLPETLKHSPALALLDDPGAGPDWLRRLEPRIRERLQGEAAD